MSDPDPLVIVCLLPLHVGHLPPINHSSGKNEIMGVQLFSSIAGGVLSSLGR
jgi:hypothetical protein